MKKRFNKLAGWMICIVFAVFLLYIKDNMGYIFSGISTLLSILTPFIYGFGIAYIMNFPYRFFRNKVFGKIKAKWVQKINKGISITISYILVLGIICFLITLLIPSLRENIQNLVKNVPSYINSFTKYSHDLLVWLKTNFGVDVYLFNNLNGVLADWISGIANMDNVNKVFSALTGTITFFYNWIMGLVLSIYMLANKEFLFNQFKRLGAAFLPTKWMPSIYTIINVSDEKCGKFLVGKVVDSVIVGVMCYVLMVIFKLPYAQLISVIVGVCNIIPFFGPFIWTVASGFLLFLVSPWDCLIFVIIALVIQQIDGNLISPKIVGASVGLNGFWLLFSVMVAAALFGLPGMILGTPIFATIYTLVGRKTNKRIKMKGESAENVIKMSVIQSAKLTNVKATKKSKRIKAKLEAERAAKLETEKESDEKEETENDSKKVAETKENK